jgi:hypothetical protein
LYPPIIKAEHGGRKSTDDSRESSQAKSGLSRIVAQSEAKKGINRMDRIKAKGKSEKEKVRMRSMLFIFHFCPLPFSFCLLFYPVHPV